MDFNLLMKEIHKSAKDHGFWGDQNNRHLLAVKVALIHSEASELLVALRQLNVDTKAVAEELADIVIRTMDLAEALDVDLEQAIYEKVKRNKDRAFKHGKKF